MKFKLFALSLLVCLCAFGQPRVSMTATYSPVGTPATLVLSLSGNAASATPAAAYQVTIPVPTGSTVAPGPELTGSGKSLFYNLSGGSLIMLVVGLTNATAAPDGVFAVVTFPSAAFVDFAPSGNLAADELGTELALNATGYVYSSPCDLNRDGKTDQADLQLVADQVNRKTACTNGDLTLDGKCNAADAQRVSKAANGGACVTGK